ncbi:MAG: hypothetical protein ACRDP9_14695 [Kribbellaceae bacterium]
MTGPTGPAGANGARRLSRTAARQAKRKKAKRRHQLVGAGLVIALLIGGGAYAAVAGSRGDDGAQSGDDGTTQPKSDDNRDTEPQVLADETFLLDAAGAKQIAPGSWTITNTAEGSKGPERSFTCQSQRFADPAGVRTWVRQFKNGATQTAVQYVELSSDPGGAQRAYNTIVGWMSGCATPKQRLVASYTADGFGDRGIVAVFAQPVGGKQVRYRTLAVAGTGAATMVFEYIAVATSQPRTAGTVGAAGAALKLMCTETESACPHTLELKPSLLTANTEPPGFMTPIDLPVVGALSQPWLGVDGTVNAGSGCEQINLTKAKSRKAKSRTYLVPGAKVPAEFGMDTMVAEFASPTAAQAFVSTVTSAVDKCATTQSNAKVKRTKTVQYRGGINGQTWRVVYDLGTGSITYRVGLVRAGKRAVHVVFPVMKGLDISDDAFADVLARAGQRSFYFR